MDLDAPRGYLADLQQRIVARLEAIDGASFRRDTWQRPEGGGGTSCVIEEGRVFERGSPDELIKRFGREDMEEVFLDMARGRGRGLDALRKAGAAA